MSRLPTLAGATAQLALAHTDPIDWRSYADLAVICGVIWMIVAELVNWRTAEASAEAPQRPAAGEGWRELQ